MTSLDTSTHLPIARLSATLLVGILAVSASAILISATTAPGLVGAFMRVSFSLVLLAPLWLRRARWESLAALDTSQRMALLGAGLCLGVHFWAWFESIKYTSVAASVLLVTTNPLWVALLSPWLLKQRTRPQLWLGISIAFGGAAFIALGAKGGSAKAPLYGNTLALLGGLMSSGYLLWGRKVRPALDLWSYASVTLAMAWVVLGFGVWWMGLPLWPYPTQDWYLFVSMALVPQMLGHNSINWSLRYLSADTIAVLLLFEPIGSTALAWLLLAQIPHPLIYPGGAALLLGTLLVLREEAKRHRQTPKNTSDDPQ